MGMRRLQARQGGRGRYGDRLVPRLGHGVAPQRLLRERHALVDPSENGVNLPVFVWIESGLVAPPILGDIEEPGQVVHQRGMPPPIGYRPSA
jgi:hypothetical protein